MPYNGQSSLSYIDTMPKPAPPLSFGNNTNTGFGLDKVLSPSNIGYIGGFQMPGLTSKSGAANAGNVPAGSFDWGKVTAGLEAFSALNSLLTGFQGRKMAKDSFKFQKSMYKNSFNADATLVNSAQRDQWAARNASAKLNNRPYENLDSFMAPREIKHIA